MYAPQKPEKENLSENKQPKRGGKSAYEHCQPPRPGALERGFRYPNLARETPHYEKSHQDANVVIKPTCHRGKS